MKLKSITIKEYFKNKNYQLDDLPNNLELVIDGTNISKRFYKEEINNIKNDLKNLLDNPIFSIVFKNINIEECAEMDYIMQKIGSIAKKVSIQNSNIGNLDLYMSAVSGKRGKNYSLSGKQYIKEFEYYKENGMLVIAAENLDILSEINRYKKPNFLKIKIYSKNDLKNLITYIDVIREMKLSNNILVDKTEEKINDIYKYENYINEKVIIFQSDLMKKSIGLDKLPTKKINQTAYDLKIDGSKINKGYIYVLEGEEETLFIKDMRDVIKYLNIVNVEYKNVIFPDKYEIKQVISEVEKSKLNINYAKEDCIIVKRSILDIIKEKLYKVFNINFGIDRKQKLLPIYNKKNF